MVYLLDDGNEQYWVVGDDVAEATSYFLNNLDDLSLEEIDNSGFSVRQMKDEEFNQLQFVDYDPNGNEVMISFNEMLEDYEESEFPAIVASSKGC